MGTDVGFFVGEELVNDTRTDPSNWIEIELKQGESVEFTIVNPAAPLKPVFVRSTDGGLPKLEK